jgi:DNA ligase-associated metallophosphoesterase
VNDGDGQGDGNRADTAPDPGGTLAVTMRGETLRLHPDRAVSWPARRTLVVADVHFGKDDVFRRAGLAIPAGAVQEDLERLSRLLADTACERLLVLGDFVHGTVADGDAFPPLFTRWRARHRELAVEVVAGNHDRHAQGGHGEWASTLRWHAGTLHEPPFDFVHDATDEVAAARTAAFTLSGHVHPVTPLPVPGGRSLRVPVFWRRAAALVLPAFGRLTGGHVVRAAAGEQLIVAGPGRVHRLRTVGASRRGRSR